MKYVIDKIEEGYVTLENLETKEKLIVEVKKLPLEIHEGTVLNKKEEEFSLDLDTEQKRRKMLQDKLNRLKKIKKQY